MKRILLLAASAALLLTGCQKNEMAVQNMEGQQEISFQTYSGREVTKAALNSGSFNVTAYKQDNSVESLYYSNVTYTWNSTSSCFASDPAKYWPSTGKLDFYAVMPTSLTADKKVKFTANGTTDFSAATLTGQDNTSNPSLTFGHKLTKVAFKAVGADTRLMYEITGITLTAKDTATFDISAGTWGSNGTKTNTYTVLSAKDTIKAGTSAAKSVGSTLYLLPANAASLNVKYNVYENGQKIDDGAATSGITVDLSSTSASWAVNSSYLYTLTLNLTSSVSPITFNAEQTDWGSETGKDVTVKQKVYVTSISITCPDNHDNIFPDHMRKTDSFQLKAEVSPDNATDKSVTWSSSDPAVASISDLGMISVSSNPTYGTTKITATAKDGSNKSCEVIVTVEGGTPIAE